METPIHLIDLTYPINDRIPTWSGDKGHELKILSDYKDFTAPDMFRTNEIKCFAGIGTHIDAPAHMVLGGRTVEQLTLSELFSECIVIDVSAEADENTLIGPEALAKYEAEHGEIPAASFVLFHTGWGGLYWQTPEKYRNGYKFPSLSPATAEALIFRGVAGVGIDTLSVDTGQNGFPAHRILLDADRYIVENVANAKLLPLSGARVLILPMHLEGATEAPARMVAMV